MKAFADRLHATVPASWRELFPWLFTRHVVAPAPDAASEAADQTHAPRDKLAPFDVRALPEFHSGM